MSVDVSVIIPTYNRRESLQRTLESLAQQTFSTDDFEVIVVDDGSTDSTAQIQQIEWPFTLQYYYQENQGIAVARNWAVRQSRAKYIAFLDDDIVVNQQYIEAMLTGLKVCKLSILMACLKYPPQLPDTPFHQYYVSTLQPNCEAKEQFVTVPLPFYECTGGVIALRRHDYLELGGTQELPHGGKTTWGGLDLAFRAYKANFNFYHSQNAIAIHHDHGIQTFSHYCQHAYRASYFAVLLLQKYPELETLVPLFHDRGPINLRHDPPGINMRRTLRYLMRQQSILKAMLYFTHLLEKNWRQPSILRRLYVWISSTYITLGIKDGINEFGKWR